MSTPDPKHLDIGCGSQPRDGYTGVDLFVEAPGIIKAPMWQLPNGPNEIDAIFSSHALEHVGKYEIAPTLQEWFRVLRPGGVLELIVPDSRWFCKNWLEKAEVLAEREWEHATLFGLQDHAGEFHKSAYTPLLLKIDLIFANFEGIKIEEIQDHGQGSLRATAYKP